MVAISQREDLLLMSDEELYNRAVRLETFTWNLAWKFFSQDDFSRKDTARERNTELTISARQAREHWSEDKGDIGFAGQFKDVDAIMEAFRSDDIDEKLPFPPSVVLCVTGREELCTRVITLETFVRNLAQRYFSQDDFSRGETANKKGVKLTVNGKDASAHWVRAGGPKYFRDHFKSIDAIMKAFLRDGVGEKPPPPD